MAILAKKALPSVLNQMFAKSLVLKLENPEIMDLNQDLKFVEARKKKLDKLNQTLEKFRKEMPVRDPFYNDNFY